MSWIVWKIAKSQIVFVVLNYAKNVDKNDII